MRGWKKRAALAAAVVVLAGACDDDGPLYPGDYPVYEMEQAGERFHVAVKSPTVAAKLDSLKAAGTPASVLMGTLVRGNGGFNAPYSWHLDPATVEVVDMAIELCDGRPSFVEDELDYFMDKVKRYCPWGPKVIGRQ